MNESVDIAKIRRKARKSLNGKYKIAVASTLIYVIMLLLCIGIANFIKEPAMFIFLSLIITSLFYMGLLQIMIKIARDKETNILEIFQRTDAFFRCAAITIIFLAINTLFAILEYTAVKSLFVFVTYQADLHIALSSFMIVVGLILSLVIAIFWLFLIICLSQSYYILYDNEDMPLGDIFRLSMDMMDGHKLDYIVMCLTFIGWFILGIFTLGILWFWIIPYMNVSLVKFYDKIKKDVKIEA